MLFNTAAPALSKHGRNVQVTVCVPSQADVS